MTAESTEPVGAYEIIEVARPPGMLFVARPTGQLALSHAYGHAVLTPSTWGKSPYIGAMELSTLAVKAPHRRQGVGTALVRRAFAWSDAHGYSMTMVTAYALSEGAIAFYRSLGLHPHYITFDTYWTPPQ